MGRAEHDIEGRWDLYKQMAAMVYTPTNGKDEQEK